MTCNQLKEQLRTLRAMTIRLSALTIVTIQDADYFTQSYTLMTEAKQGIQLVRKEILTHRIEEAEKILGANFLGPRAVDGVFGKKIDFGDLPLLPLNYEDLQVIKEENKMLILRIDSDQNGQPLTLNNMIDSMSALVRGLTVEFDVEPIVDDHLRSKIIEKLTESPLAKKQTPKYEWVVIDHLGIATTNAKPDLAGQSIAKRTRELVNQFKHLDLAAYYRALAAFDYASIDPLDSSLGMQVAKTPDETINKGLFKNLLLKLALPNIAEAFYDRLLYWWAYQQTKNSSIDSQHQLLDSLTFMLTHNAITSDLIEMPLNNVGASLQLYIMIDIKLNLKRIKINIVATDRRFVKRKELNGVYFFNWRLNR